MKQILVRVGSEVVTIVALMVVFALTAVLVGAAIDVVWPSADRESAVVRISSNRNGVPALLIAFVATMYTYRFALTSQYKQAESKTE